jgi:tetratricopeptide (TPR) repeat protein
MHSPKIRDCLVTYYDYRRRKSPAIHADALHCFQDLSARQPDEARVWSGLAMLHVDDYAAMFGRGGDDQLKAARDATEKALLLDPNDFLANLALVRVQFFDGDPGYLKAIERTIELRPGNAQALAQGGFLLTVRGDTARGLAMVQKAREIAKVPPPLYHLAYAAAYLRDERFPEALAASLKIDAEHWVVAQAFIAAAAGHAGRAEVAGKARQRLLELYPEFEDDALARFERWRFDPALCEILIDGLKEAGLDLRAPVVSVSGG